MCFKNLLLNTWSGPQNFSFLLWYIFFKFVLTKVNPVLSLFFLGTPLFFALVKGDIKSMFQYADHPEEALAETPEATEEEKKEK